MRYGNLIRLDVFNPVHHRLYLLAGPAPRIANDEAIQAILAPHPPSTGHWFQWWILKADDFNSRDRIHFGDTVVLMSKISAPIVQTYEPGPHLANYTSDSYYLSARANVSVGNDGRKAVGLVSTPGASEQWIVIKSNMTWQPAETLDFPASILLQSKSLGTYLSYRNDGPSPVPTLQSNTVPTYPGDFNGDSQNWTVEPERLESQVVEQVSETSFDWNTVRNRAQILELTQYCSEWENRDLIMNLKELAEKFLNLLKLTPRETSESAARSSALQDVLGKIENHATRVLNSPTPEKILPSLFLAGTLHIAMLRARFEKPELFAQEGNWERQRSAVKRAIEDYSRQAKRAKEKIIEVRHSYFTAHEKEEGSSLPDGRFKDFYFSVTVRDNSTGVVREFSDSITVLHPGRGRVYMRHEVRELANDWLNSQKQRVAADLSQRIDRLAPASIWSSMYP